MASVFLSYDRDDTDRARPLAAVLEKAGHSVWWDLHVRSGAQFSKVIEEALKAADAVVVLWSKHSVESAWVRDEAAAGRDSGRLVPVTIDGKEPPLGFRQFQTIDLSRWRARGTPIQLRTLLADVEALAASGKTGEPPPSPAPTSRRAAFSGARSRLLVPALALLAIVAAAAVYWIVAGRSFGAPTVAVVAADASPLSQQIARDLLVKLGALQGNATTNVRLLDAPGADKGADLRIAVSGAERRAQVHANVALISGGANTVLWSKKYEQAATSRSDLEEALAFAVARVLGCAIEEASGKHGRLSDQNRRLYLNACAALAESGWDTRPVVSQLRGVVNDSPKFRPAWARLLKAETDAISWQTAASQSVETTRAQLRADIEHARALDPDMAEATLAELELMPRWTLKRAAALVDKAKLQDPENPSVLSARVQIMQLTGRMNDAIQDAERAVEADPLSPLARTELISALAYGGQTERAREELQQAKRLWPGTQWVRDAEFAFELRLGDFERALRNEGFLNNTTRLYVRARREPTDANVQSLLAHARKNFNDGPGTGFVLQALGEMNRVQEFYTFVQQPGVADLIRSGSYILFRPWLSNVRRDPRFFAFAKQLGLVDYWGQSGQWPDFCSDPDLPYDCKAEAAKYAHQP